MAIADDAGGAVVPLEHLVGRVHRLLSAKPGQRVIIGVAGAPGAGKTTLAELLVRTLSAESSVEGDGPVAAHVPMDGFHLADAELRRLGRMDRKGAPDTFDVAGYLALLRRLRTAPETVWAPAFDREIEQPIAGSIPVEPSMRVVISEGNYLLLDSGPWSGVAGAFDEIWFCAADEQERIIRLVARHVRFGKSPDQARAWALGPDQRNAELVAGTRHRADLVIDSLR